MVKNIRSSSIMGDLNSSEAVREAFPRSKTQEDLNMCCPISQGPFGDVWLATIHEDFDKCQKVAVKVLPPISEDHLGIFTGKLDKIVSVIPQGASSNVNWPRGIFMDNGKACVITKLYETSIADSMTQLPGERLPPADALRYGVDLVRGILELHSYGLMALNLKPSNFFIERDQAVLGESGIVHLLMGAKSAEGRPMLIGTPNYMAPEQWQPKIRGPIVFETDCWGFACSFVEMWTGEKPFNHKSQDEIFHAVVDRREMPVVPADLPCALRRMLTSCFKCDPRDRPTFSEILSVLQSPNGDWRNLHADDEPFGLIKKVKGPDYAELPAVRYLSSWRDTFEVGDIVQCKSSRDAPQIGWLADPHGTGTVARVDTENELVIIKCDESGQCFKVAPAHLRLVLDGLCVGDSVRLGTSLSPVGKVYRIVKNLRLVEVAFVGQEVLWEGPVNSLVKTEGLNIGDFVKLRNDVTEPTFPLWLVDGEGQWESGKISDVLPNGALVVSFPGRVWTHYRLANVEQVERVVPQPDQVLADMIQHLPEELQEEIVARLPLHVQYNLTKKFRCQMIRRERMNALKSAGMTAVPDKVTFALQFEDDEIATNPFGLIRALAKMGLYPGVMQARMTILPFCSGKQWDPTQDGGIFHVGNTALRFENLKCHDFLSVLQGLIAFEPYLRVQIIARRSKVKPTLKPDYITPEKTMRDG